MLNELIRYSEDGDEELVGFCSQICKVEEI